MIGASAGFILPGGEYESLRAVFTVTDQSREEDRRHKG
jgi:hypothetical protein